MLIAGSVILGANVGFRLYPDGDIRGAFGMIAGPAALFAFSWLLKKVTRR
jgi:hypothetical protein